MRLEAENEAKNNEEMHKANLYSLINCVDTLAELYEQLRGGNEVRKEVRALAEQVSLYMASNVFHSQGGGIS